MNIHQLDLNLLKTLLVLLKEKSTSRAAERLNTSQPAVSRTLAKLRLQLNDPLFFRESRG
ncbi:LysR family transcriptional regulator [Vibrio mexicanus]|uniref:LysR family transcriptional regulator n=1 Tax=Vibrio mexicanus TaxID=1004326 RepID=UPI00192E4F7D|nr:LysR family transcriptional regulator [Vibrio mexicanus]